MPKVETNRAKIIARLIRESWELIRHGGDHDVYRRPGKPGMIAVPRHRGLSPGVARSIARKAGWIQAVVTGLE